MDKDLAYVLGNVANRSENELLNGLCILHPGNNIFNSLFIRSCMKLARVITANDNVALTIC